MRFILNGQMQLNGETYYRVDDADRMIAEEAAGTFNAVINLGRVGLAINSHNVTPEQARKIVNAVNAALQKLPPC